jgi:hypothetical protein
LGNEFASFDNAYFLDEMSKAAESTSPEDRGEACPLLFDQIALDSDEVSPPPASDIRDRSSRKVVRPQC